METETVKRVFKSHLCPRYSPWGEIQTRHETIPGVWHVTTPSHGGFLVSQERLSAMPAQYHTQFGDGGLHAFEEDCAWCGVVLSFPDEFSPESVEDARRTFDRWYAKK